MKQYHANGIKFVERDNTLFAEISQFGVTTIYPIKKPEKNTQIKYILMDLDGTTVRSEQFWMYLIECTMKKLLNDNSFKFTKEDEPFVCGYSTPEHLKYCKKKYHFQESIEEALVVYNEITDFELKEISEGRGNSDAFKPRPGLKEFLLFLKEKGIKVGLATSGLDYKSIPEIVAAFRHMGMGEPLSIYDAIVTGGSLPKKGEYVHVSELIAKPHPWVYKQLAEALGVKDNREALIIEDSASGVVAARAAGFNVIGFDDGNLITSNLDEQCLFLANTFKDIEQFINKQ